MKTTKPSIATFQKQLTKNASSAVKDLLRESNKYRRERKYAEFKAAQAAKRDSGEFDK